MILVDLPTHSARRITTHGARLVRAAFDPSGRFIVTGDVDGTVRVGPVTGEEPHLLLGHVGLNQAIAISPDGRWIASTGEDQLFLWPTPDLSKPPLHTLPRVAACGLRPSLPRGFPAIGLRHGRAGLASFVSG